MRTSLCVRRTQKQNMTGVSHKTQNWLQQVSKSELWIATAYLEWKPRTCIDCQGARRRLAREGAACRGGRWKTRHCHRRLGPKTPAGAGQPHIFLMAHLMCLPKCSRHQLPSIGEVLRLPPHDGNGRGGGRCLWQRRRSRASLRFWSLRGRGRYLL